MDDETRVPFKVDGSYSGNRGSSNVFSSYNTNRNTYILPNLTDLKGGNQSGVPGIGRGVKQAPRPYHLIPYGRNRTFTGRKDLIESVKKFSQGEGHCRVALYGLGGSGKTQIALEYVYQRMNESDCDVFWVQASGLLKFVEGYTAIAHRVAIPLTSVEMDEEDFLRGIRRWLEGPESGEWILVIDNADNEADFIADNGPIAKFIPQGTKGTLVFTTRSRQVASRQGCRMVEVGGMGEEEAVGLFSKRFGSWDNLGGEEKTAVAMILGSLDHLPLAIIGSAAFMIETATPPSVYWTIIQENEDRMKKLLSREFSDIQREADVTESILGTFFITFDRIRQQMPIAVDLLRLMAFFDRQKIPEELLNKGGLEGVRDSVDFREAIGKLLGFSLVTIIKHGDKVLYELHRLVQLSLQVYLPIEALSQGRAAALKVISRLFPHDQDEIRYVDPAYIPHALAAIKDSTDPVAEEICFRMAWYFVYNGSYDNAELQVLRCIGLREKGGKDDWDNDGHSRFSLLALVNGYQGKYEQSEAASRHLLGRCDNILGPEHSNTLEIANNLAWVLHRRGKYAESETMNRRAMEGREKVLGPDHPDTLKSVSSLAVVLRTQGKHDESETVARRVLQGREKLLGPEHPDTLSSLAAIALALRGQGKSAESHTMYRHVLELREKVLGPNHPDTLRGFGNLALLLVDLRRYDEAEAMHLHALEGLEKVLGPDHPDTLTCISNLGAVLQLKGKYGESEALNRRALEGREKLLGPNHPFTQTSIGNLTAVLRLQGKHGELETNNGCTADSVPRNVAQTGPRSTTRQVLQFLRATMSRKDHPPTK